MSVSTFIAALERFDRAELHNSRFLEAGKAVPKKITHPISPLLQRERWGIPLNETSRGWKIISPVLHLASALLDSEPSFHLLYSVINAERCYSPRMTADTKNSCFRLRRLDPYSQKGQTIEEVRAEFKSQIELIAADLSLWLYDFDAPGHVVQPLIHGITMANGERVILSKTYGNSSRVHINKRYVDRLASLQIKYKEAELEDLPGIVKSMIRIRFCMATTLCHEMAHVIGKAANRGVVGEPFWEDQKITELGRVWESEVLGGMLINKDEPNYLQAGLWGCKWPGGIGRTVLSCCSPLVRPCQGTSTFYAIPMPYLFLLQSGVFWKKYGKSRNLKLLWFPKILGIRFANTGMEIDENWRMSQSSEGTYPDDDLGIVRREWSHQIPELEAWLKIRKDHTPSTFPEHELVIPEDVGEGPVAEGLDMDSP